MTAEDRREAIVMAAAPLFAAKGFDAITTREIAEAAGVSEALLYRHFDNKAALYAAIQDTCVLRATADAARIEALPDSTATLVLAAYLIMANIQLRSLPGQPNENIPRLILRSLLTDGQFAQVFVSSTSAKWIAKIERCIRAGIEAGEIEEPLEHAMGSAWFSHHIACAMVFYRLPGNFVVSYPGGNEPERLLDLSVKFALRGLGLTRKAIETYYQPDAFALLRNAPHAD
jgi:AcrR family transcriptional regulator